nr:PREDICTED: integrin alpha-3 isoform X2 [Lepisosteus oculatus]XP_015217780.1 PREDICTED: integrin alpha-3 isoform X2 [Lepisosteus oculatus]
MWGFPSNSRCLLPPDSPLGARRVRTDNKNGVTPGWSRVSSRDLGVLVLAFFCAARTCGGYNLDLRFPVIKEGKTNGSFFGFSVALHRQTAGEQRYLLLTGAPKEKALPQVKANETGAIYSCPVTTDPDDCTRMGLVDAVENTEMVEGMWLGVTVASQGGPNGGRVLACGHRFVKITWSGSMEQRRMIGRCFVRGNDLQYDANDDWQTSRYEVCNPNHDMELEGMCTMGISAGMTETDVYIGAPGSFLWQGNVHNTWRNPQESWDSNEKSFPDLRGQRYLYIGYSVLQEQNVLRKNSYTLITGAPRNESRGSVMLADIDATLTPRVVLLGEQLGSYFGSSIAATDLNKDGWNDLIVGAPFYFHHKREQGGSVYVFMNENGSFRDGASVVLPGAPGSGFGIAVAAIGDINQDGFQDFAVGAPFDGSGKVFIWCGRNKGISAEYSQVIEGQEVGKGGFMTFGYSIAGGLDVDDNSYPDVLVGSLDNKIALLRARPVINLSTTFAVEPKIVDPSKCTSNSCIQVNLCFSYTLSTGNKNFKRNITLAYDLSADRDRRSPRVRFLSNNQNTYRGSFSMPETSCQTLELVLVDSNIQDKLHPVVFALNFSLAEQTQRGRGRRALQNLDGFPILREGHKLSETAEINFQKDCGDDNRCRSNLQLSALFASEQQVPLPSQGGLQVLQYSTSVKKLLLVVNVTNLPSGAAEAEDAHRAELNVTIPAALRYSGVRSSHSDKKNIVCSADETLLCQLGNPFKSNEKATILIIFETSGINLYTDKIETQLQLSTLSEQSDLNPVPVLLQVVYSVDVTFSMTQSQVKTSFSGTVMGESAMKQTRDIGSPVDFTFKVQIQGEPLGSIGTLEVEIDWPYEVPNGKWLLYPTEVVTRGTAETRCVPPGDIINPLNLTLSSTDSGRRKREADGKEKKVEPQAAITVQKAKKEDFLLDCAVSTARCEKFTCPLRNMSNEAQVTVRARVWNSTLLEDYINAWQVKVKGRATLKLQTDKPTIRMSQQTTEFEVQILPVLGKEVPYEIPLWIIIVAVLAGVLLLGLIILLLWKCGFFRRASRREMYEAKAQKAEMKIQPSETERLTEDY